MRDKIQNDQFTTNFQQGDEFFAGDAWDAGRFCTSDRSHGSLGTYILLTWKTMVVEVRLVVRLEYLMIK
jgi:hypothetical protein